MQRGRTPRNTATELLGTSHSLVLSFSAFFAFFLIGTVIAVTSFPLLSLSLHLTLPFKGLPYASSFSTRERVKKRGSKEETEKRRVEKRVDAMLSVWDNGGYHQAPFLLATLLLISLTEVHQGQAKEALLISVRSFSPHINRNYTKSCFVLLTPRRVSDVKLDGKAILLSRCTRRCNDQWRKKMLMTAKYVKQI